MALFNKKTKDEASAESGSVKLEVSKSRNVVVTPRISEKAGILNKMNKYVFKITGKMNKVEVKRTIEKLYSVNVTGVNMITVQSKVRNFGRTPGKTSPFKKAVVTLKAGQTIEAAKES